MKKEKRVKKFQARRLKMTKLKYYEGRSPVTTPGRMVFPMGFLQ
jgi:hypothetical protein